MQTATILLHLAGDPGNTVPKCDITAAEIAVLRVIHGGEAVQEIAPTGDVDRSNREELVRLRSIYGKTERDKCPVENLFPGAAARVFEDLAELDIPEAFYKALARVAAPAPSRKATGKKAAAASAAPAENDGIGDMSDGVLG